MLNQFKEKSKRLEERGGIKNQLKENNSKAEANIQEHIKGMQDQKDWETKIQEERKWS